MKHTFYKYFPLAALWLAFPLHAQEAVETDATSYRAEIMGSAATGDNTRSKPTTPICALACFTNNISGKDSAGVRASTL